MFDTVVLDIDGTLVDTNYHHVIAWDRAFRHHDVAVPLWRVHRAIGMGGDRLLAYVAGDEAEDRYGDQIRARWEEEFDQLIDEVRPVDDAVELARAVKSRDLKLVLASSGKKKHVESYLDLLDARSIADAWTTADDVDDSKPAPDLLQVAIDRVEGTSAVKVGDSVWDCRAAGEAEVPSIGVLTGGFSREELLNAGAARVYTSLRELIDDLDQVIPKSA
jgi:phosphoglycolate phosphatase-like HAD superfamily hydrolase